MAADQYINATGVVAIRDWINGKFATSSALNDLSDKVDDIVAEGGEPNVIETVKVNGTALTPDAQKAVEIVVPKIEVVGNEFTVLQPQHGPMMTVRASSSESQVISISVSRNDDADFIWDGFLASTDYVREFGGKIDKIKVNGTEQTITNKEVDLTVPTKLSDLTNDGDGTTGSTYALTSDVESAISSAVASAYKYKGSVATQDDLPTSGQESGDVYDVQATGMNYAWNGSAWDALGQYVDTSVFWTSTAGQTNSLTAMTVAEINAILEPSS